MTTKTFPLSRTYRLDNYKEFIDVKFELVKNHDVCLIILTYNNLEVLKTILGYVENAKIDILIVDNCSIDGTTSYLLDNYSKRINILKLNSNYGGAGGYAVGQEWVLEKGYEFCMISEDDALPISEDIIEEMIDKCNQNTIIQTRYFNLPNQLFTLHFILYPTKIFLEAGVMNSRLFLGGGDDYEYGLRLQRAINDLKVNAVCIDKYYSHPYVKKGFGITTTYFTVRNSLMIAASDNKIFEVFRSSFIYLCYSIYSLFEIMDVTLFRLVINGLHDFLFFNTSRNKYIIEKYKGKVLKPTLAPDIQQYSFESFNENFSEYTAKTAFILDRPKIFPNIKTKGSINQIIITKFKEPSRMWLALCNKAIIIEEVDLTNQYIYLWKYSNKHQIIKILNLAFATFFASTITILLSPIIFSISKYYKFKCTGFYPAPKERILFHRNWNEDIFW